MRVLLVDDDPIVRIGLRLMFRSMPEVEIVAEAADGGEVLAALQGHHIDTILMDVRMRTVNGITAARAVRTRFPSVRIVLMSTFLNDDFAAHAKNIGGAEFVPKTASADVFRRALMKDAPVQPAAPAEASALPGLETLTVRELHVARLVAEGHTNDGIAQQSHLSINSVKTYVSRALAKLHLSNRVQLANLINHPTHARTRSRCAYDPPTPPQQPPDDTSES
ncbi:response regulator transcription factor [Plantibacter sp. RU18]|uniref:response regulator transcription factor n=1 Tax=Plantibacter sp. RU18 TaxID=3158143 RepID=UPI003D36BF67